MPTGDLADGAYDPLGNYYQLPAHIVSDPTNISSGANGIAALGESKADLTAGEDTAQGEDDQEQRREEKGKAVVNTRDLVSVTIRMSDTSRDLKVEVGKDETVRSIINYIVQEIGVSPPRSLEKEERFCLLTGYLSSSAPPWLSRPPYLHRQGPEREYLSYGSRLEAWKRHQRLRLRTSSLATGVRVAARVDARPG